MNTDLALVENYANSICPTDPRNFNAAGGEQDVRWSVARARVRKDDLATRTNHVSIVCRAMATLAHSLSRSREVVDRKFQIFLRKQWTGSNLRTLKNLDMGAANIVEWALIAYVKLFERSLRQPPNPLTVEQVRAWRHSFYPVLWVKGLVMLDGHDAAVNGLILHKLNDETVSAINMPKELLSLLHAAYKDGSCKATASYCSPLPPMCWTSFIFGEEFCSDGEEECDELHGCGRKRCEHKVSHRLSKCSFSKGLSKKAKGMVEGAIGHANNNKGRRRKSNGGQGDKKGKKDKKKN